MITVMFYGSLRTYGRRFDLCVNTPAQAMKLLMVQISGLKASLQSGAYRVRFKGLDLSEDDVKTGFHEQGEGVLHIVPRVSGAGKNSAVAQIVIGVVLIAASWYAGGAAGWGYLGAQGYAGATMAFMMGSSMILGGVTQLLTQPKQPKLSDKSEDRGRNTAFSGLNNPAGQGMPVPVLYGRRRCGAYTVSQGIETRRIGVAVAVKNGRQVSTQVVTPVAAEQSSGFLTTIDKEYTGGVVARDPKGVPYNTDFTNDSVRQRNYRAIVKKV